MKYDIDPELHKIAKFKIPRSPKLLMAMNRMLRVFRCKSDDLVTVRGGLIPGYRGEKIPAYIIEPKLEQNDGEALPCLVYFHGGAFMLKASAAHYRLAKEYAAKGLCKVIFADFFQISGRCSEFRKTYI